MDSEFVGAGVTAIEFAKLARRIAGEYREMPGLSVTAAQARRLWSLDNDTCDALLRRMTADGRLRLTKDGHYVWAEQERP
jgi:DNA-binding transcriptional LysR family regulator